MLLYLVGKLVHKNSLLLISSVHRPCMNELGLQGMQISVKGPYSAQSHPTTILRTCKCRISFYLNFQLILFFQGRLWLTATNKKISGHRTETCYTQYVQTKLFLIKSWKISQKLPSQNNSHTFIHKIACQFLHISSVH